MKSSTLPNPPCSWRTLLLATEKPNEAAALLVGLGDSAPVKAKILLGIAHAQQNSMDLAKAVAATCKLDDNSGPDLAYNLACLQSLTGNKEAAIDSPGSRVCIHAAE